MASLRYIASRNETSKYPMQVGNTTVWIDVTVDEDRYQLYLYTYEKAFRYEYVEILSSSDTRLVREGLLLDQRVPKNILLSANAGGTTMKIKNLPAVPGETGSLYTYKHPLFGDTKILCISP